MVVGGLPVIRTLQDGRHRNRLGHFLGGLGWSHHCKHTRFWVIPWFSLIGWSAQGILGKPKTINLRPFPRSNLKSESTTNIYTSQGIQIWNKKLNKKQICTVCTNLYKTQSQSAVSKCGVEAFFITISRTANHVEKWFFNRFSSRFLPVGQLHLAWKLLHTYW